MPSGTTGLKLGLLEPHLRRYGGIRHVVELANHLVDRGHQVTIYVPRTERLECTWMLCRAAVRCIDDGWNDELDVLVFNEEPQWYLLERFPKARHRVFYALHYGRIYDKPGSWEALRASVDLQIANSGWTADQIEAETGVRPTVIPPGIDRSLFRPYGTGKRYPLLCTGGDERDWKGVDTIRDAARRVGLPVEEYAGKDLAQPALAREYDAAEIFAVGSWFEGFGLPGLEALACGVPLVTTDNGGSREYAIDGETALVVPPRDSEQMADAIERLRHDPGLATRLADNGLDLVRREFGWDKRAHALEEVLEGVATSPAPVVTTRSPSPETPVLSVVVLVWNNLELTQQCIETIRQNTDVPYELIVVDNGSHRDTADYARQAADVSVLNETNRGFAGGMNQGLEAASGEFVAFCNNDIEVPERWASQLVETARAHKAAGIVVPALTAPANLVTARSVAGEAVTALGPFSPPPPAVVYLMPSDLARDLGGWNEAYEIASGEDLDLAFAVWVNDLDIVFDERVLVRHVGSASATKLSDWRGLWDRNRGQFLARWQSPDAVLPMLEGSDPGRFERNRATAAAAAGWMEQYFAARDRSLRAIVDRGIAREGLAMAARRWASAVEAGGPPWLARMTWEAVSPSGNGPPDVEEPPVRGDHADRR